MRKCPICHCNESRELCDLEYALFDDLHLSGAIQLVQCHLCGMAYNRSLLTENDYLHYYRKNDHYLEATSPGTGGFSDLEQLRYQRVFKHIKPHLAYKNPVVLDFGCGKGGLLQWLKRQHNWKLFGVEASQACRQYIKNFHKFPVYSSLSEVKKNADVIILSHVLEHLFYPEKILNELGRICHDKTIVYVEVPMAEDYLNTPVKWQQLYFEHINHFGPGTLHRLLSSCSFDTFYKTQVHFFQDEPASPMSLVFLARKSLEHTNSNLCENKLTITQTKPFQQLLDKVQSNTKPISIWGVSQYTQLLMGTCPSLTARVKYLFDSSSAKIGRTIRNIKIHPPEKLSHLGKDDFLFFPKGRHSVEMSQHLNRIHYEGEIIQY